jgi:hypothetical protein
MKRIARADSPHQSQRRIRFEDILRLIHTLSDAGAGQFVLRDAKKRLGK